MQILVYPYVVARTVCKNIADDAKKDMSPIHVPKPRSQGFFLEVRKGGKGKGKGKALGTRLHVPTTCKFPSRVPAPQNTLYQS